MSEEKLDKKNMTMSFTPESHAKLKEMSKRYGVNMWMMLDSMIETVDEQSEEFNQSVEKWQSYKGANKKMSPEVAAVVNKAFAGKSPEEIQELLNRAQNMQ